jgi:hypothetical protein
MKTGFFRQVMDLKIGRKNPGGAKAVPLGFNRSDSKPGLWIMLLFNVIVMIEKKPVTNVMFSKL